MTGTRFDDLTDVYEAMIDWPKRLAHEEPFYRRLFEDVGARRVIDVACGTGVVARQALARVGTGGQVVGLDMNPNMLMMARRRAPSVAWHEGNAMALPFPDHAFDVVVCQQGLQFVPDLSAALEQMRRVLPPEEWQGVYGGNLLRLLQEGGTP